MRRPDGSARIAAALSLALATAGAHAQSSPQDAGALPLPPPPPPDPPGPSEPPSALESGAAIPVAPASSEALAASRARAEGSSRSAVRTLARLRAVIADQAGADRTGRQVLGAGLLVGGGVVAALAAVPLTLPAPSSFVRDLNTFTALSLFTAGTGVAVAGIVTLSVRSPWEEMENEFAADGTIDPRIQLSQALSRWSVRADRERASARLAGGLLIATGVLFSVSGIVAFTTIPSGGFGVSATSLGIGALCIPSGIANFFTLTPSERALRAFRLSQGGRLGSLSSNGLGLRLGVAPIPSGLSLVGVF